jgi:asparagine synthase (glutamine-hydrolysing)
MCGIFGAIGRDLSGSALDNVLRMLEHRGPDGEGVFIEELSKVTLAHTRLAVIDLLTGAQPLFSVGGEIVLVCNGEIYDFERVRGSLEAKGHRFNTRSDSEVIIYLYREYGLGCFEHLRGEFAFLLYDRARRLFIAGRDRFGIKPLYVSRLDDGFSFASEMKALFASGLVTPRLNPAGFDPLLEQDPADLQLPFEGINQVPPASYLAVDLDTLESRVVSYWSPQIPVVSAEPMPEPEGTAFDAAAATTLRELEDAVRLRLRADVPVGLYLSGGIDSAFVGALMKRNLDTPLHSFSICFPGSDRNEQVFARRSAEFLGTDHHELTLTREMLWNHLADCLWFTELPFATLAPVGKFLLSREARRHVTVVLNGQGADELFLGYRGFFEKALRDTRDPPRKADGVRLRRMKQPWLSAPFARKLSLLFFHKDQRARIARARAGAATRPAPSGALINRVQEARIAEMPIDILGFLGDRVEMAHSLEVRVPYLDHKLYDSTKWIPADFKLRGGVEKAVLRDAAKGLLPEDIRTRRKLGFMLTSDKIDLFGADRELTQSLRPYLSREAFDGARIFSYRAYRLASLLARLPASKRFPALKRLRWSSNKAIMVMLQAHMLHRMYVEEPLWAAPTPLAADLPEPAPAYAL